MTISITNKSASDTIAGVENTTVQLSRGHDNDHRPKERK